MPSRILKQHETTAAMGPHAHGRCRLFDTGAAHAVGAGTRASLGAEHRRGANPDPVSGASSLSDLGIVGCKTSLTPRDDLRRPPPLQDPLLALLPSERVLGAIDISDANGIVRESSRTDPELVFGVRERNPANDAWVMPVSRRITTADGRLAGVRGPNRPCSRLSLPSGAAH